MATARKTITRGVDRVTDLDGPADDWRYQWLHFARSLPGVIDPPMPDADAENEERLEVDQLEWIDEVIKAFCTRCRALDRFSRIISQRAS